MSKVYCCRIVHVSISKTSFGTDNFWMGVFSSFVYIVCDLNTDAPPPPCLFSLRWPSRCQAWLSVLDHLQAHLTKPVPPQLDGPQLQPQLLRRARPSALSCGSDEDGVPRMRCCRWGAISQTGSPPTQVRTMGVICLTLTPLPEPTHIHRGSSTTPKRHNMEQSGKIKNKTRKQTKEKNCGSCRLPSLTLSFPLFLLLLSEKQQVYQSRRLQVHVVVWN